MLAAAFLVALVLSRLVRHFAVRRSLMAPAELRRRLGQGDDLLVLDVRSPAEFDGEGGHLDGAVNLPLDRLRARLGEVGGDLAAYKSAEVVLVCRTQNRSTAALGVMRRAGFTRLWVLAGGMSAWSRDRLTAADPA